MPAIWSRSARCRAHRPQLGRGARTITSAPAEAIGMGGEIGSLRPGRRADVVIWDGDPLENQLARRRW
jgi:cytosine/adenosine deaminase-related metal-dependent hydrolase